MKWLLISLGFVIVLVGAVFVIGMMLPKAHVASRSSRFKQPPQAVWDAITGPPDWRPDVRAAEQLSPHNGRRTWKETDKHGQAITFEAVEESPPRRLVTRIADPKLPFGGTWTQEISADHEESVLTITEAGEVYNPIFRFMARFVFGYSRSIEQYLKELHTKFGEKGD